MERREKLGERMKGKDNIKKIAIILGVRVSACVIVTAPFVGVLSSTTP